MGVDNFVCVCSFWFFFFCLMFYLIVFLVRIYLVGGFEYWILKYKVMKYMVYGVCRIICLYVSISFILYGSFMEYFDLIWDNKEGFL